MKLTFTSEQLNDTETEGLAIRLVLRELRPKKSGELYLYDINNADQEDIAAKELKVLLEKQVQVEGVTLYIKVPLSTIDNKVPKDWPGANKADPSDAEKTVTKRFDEYSLTQKGKTESVVGIGFWPVSKGVNKFHGVKSKSKPDEVKRAVDYLAKGDYSKIIFGKEYQDWKVTNGIDQYTDKKISM